MFAAMDNAQLCYLSIDCFLQCDTGEANKVADRFVCRITMHTKDNTEKKREKKKSERRGTELGRIRACSV